MNWAFFLKSWQSNLADRIGSSSNWSWENVASYCSWTKGMVKQTVTTNERLKRLWIYESHILELRIKTWIWAIFVVMNTIWASTAPVSQRSWAQIPYTPEFFSGLFHYCPSSVHYCEDRFHIHNERLTTFCSLFLDNLTSQFAFVISSWVCFWKDHSSWQSLRYRILPNARPKTVHENGWDSPVRANWPWI